MAKANQKLQSDETETQERPDPKGGGANVPAVQSGGALATVSDADFGADAGAGMEGTTTESFAIPFLNVLQKGSPQVDEASGVAIEGAKSGMLFETVSGKLIDGKVGAVLIPCAYKRVFIHWGPREGAGGGFKGELAPEDVAQMRADGRIKELDGRLYAPNPDGTVHEKKSDRFSDTRNHYCLLLDEATGSYTPVLLSLTSTQIKKSKALMSLLAGVKVRNAQGAMFTPPTFANRVRIVTVPESNDKGTWHGAKFELLGRVATAEIYAAAKAFHQSVVKGAVQAANYDQSTAAEGADARSDDSRPGF
jgi:hypothetical protein